MIRFELKKLFKQKIPIYLFVFSILMSIFVLYRSGNIEIEKEFREYNTVPADYIISTAVNRQFVDNQSIQDELFKIYTEKAELSNPYSSKFLDYTKIAYDKKSKLEKQQILERITNIDFEFFKDAQKIVEKYDVKFQDQEKQTWDWAVYEHKYSEENGTYPKSVFHSYLSTNFARMFIYNTNIIFGYPFIIFLILIFYNILIREKDDGTLELLKLNSVRLKELISSKFFTMLLIITMYPILIFIIILIFSYFSGYKIDGFNEIYRIFDPNSLNFIGAKQLILKIIVIYVIISSIFSAIIILINLLIRKKNTALLALTSLVFIGNIVTERLSLFNESYNIFYGLDYLRLITGRVIDSIQNNYYEVIEIYPKNIYVLAVILVAIFLFHFSIRYKNNYLSKYSKNFSIKSKPKNLLAFEIKKILLGNNIVLLALLLVFLAAYNFISLKNENDSFNKFLYKDATRVSDYENNINRIKKELDQYKADTMKEFNMTEKEVENEDNNYKFRLKYLNSQLEQHNLVSNIVNAFNSKQSNKYYNNMLKYSKYMFERFSGESYEFKFSTRQLSKISRFEHELKMKYAFEKNLEPVEINSFEYSEYEDFVNETVKSDNMKIESLKSNSPFSVLKILNREYKLEITFIAFMILLIFNGYLIDKEENRQIDLYNLQPISKFKNHIFKLFAQISVISIFFVTFYGLIFLISYFSVGMGEINYPVVEYTKIVSNNELLSSKEFSNTIKLIPMWKYMLNYNIIFLLQLTLVASIMTLISIFSKNKAELILKFVLLLFLGMLINMISKSNIIGLFNPVTYLRTSEIANNSIIIHKNNSMLSLNNSIKILSAWTLITTFLGGLIAKVKRQ